MGSEMEACSECTRSCLSLHRRMHDPYPIGFSFFKVMLGQELKQLFLPPRIARTLTSLRVKSTYLEDSTGQKWNVDLSNVNGSLAIQKGWKEFIEDHGIESGNFVVFHYHKGSHFTVQIFNKSGCEKPMIFSGRTYQNKRSKLANHSVPVEAPDIKSPGKYLSNNSRMDTVPEVCGIKKHSKGRKRRVETEDVVLEENISKRPRVTPVEDLQLEPYFTTDRNTSFIREDDRDYLLDLSSFEMPLTKLIDVGAASIIPVNTSSQVVDEPLAVQIDMDSLVEVPLVCATAEEYTLPTIEAGLLGEESSLSPDVDKHIDLSIEFPHNVTASRVSDFLSASVISLLSGKTARTLKKEPESCPPVGDFGVADNSPNFTRDCLQLPDCKDIVIEEGDLGNSDVMALDVSSPVYLMHNDIAIFCNYKPVAVMKSRCYVLQDTEPNLLQDTEPNLQQDNVQEDSERYVQQDTESFRDLAESSPTKTSSRGSTTKRLLLRDPVGRLWPVLYHERAFVKI